MLRRLLAVLLLSTAVIGSAADLTVDPRAKALVLQQQAVDRLDALMERYRSTMDLAPLRPDLLQADAELTQSNETLRALGDDADLALGLIKQGKVWHLQSQYGRAVALYRDAYAAALRAGDLAHQAGALSGKASTEHARGDPRQAVSDAEQALRLAQASGDKDELNNALNVLTNALIGRGDLIAAADMSKREFVSAAQASFRLATFLAYVNRSLIHIRNAEKCDYMGDVVPCFEALASCREDVEAALAIARQLNYPGLEGVMSEQLRMIETIRAVIDNRGRLYPRPTQ